MSTDKLTRGGGLARDLFAMIRRLHARTLIRPSSTRVPAALPLLLLLGAGLACAAPGSSSAPPELVLEQAVQPPPAESAQGSPLPPTSRDIVFYNGVVLTMDEAHPAASAVHIRGDRIVAVGDEAEVLAGAGAGATLVDLGGRTLMPGFVDAHSHMFGEIEPAAAQEVLFQTGVTTSAELAVDERLLEGLLELDQEGGLRLRLSAYLLYNTACGEPLDDWFSAYAPTRRPGERLRIGGIKIYADGGSCNVPAVTFEYPGGNGRGDLYFTADELTAVVRELDRAGWQVAVHALGDRALDVVLEAYTRALEGSNPRRHRIEHNAILRPDQLPRYTQAGAVATLFGPFQTCVTLGDRSPFRYLVPEAYRTWEWPWRHLLDANPNVHFAWHGDMPDVFGTEVAQHLYGFVTRSQVAEDGTICRAPGWLAENALTVREALRLMTIGAAYALDRDQEVGSLAPGKLADLIVLSDDPTTMPPEALKDLRVLMTMVGGRVEHCAEGLQALCPEAVQPPPAAAPPSASFRDEFDGALAPGWTWLNEDPSTWSLTASPGWLRIGLSTGNLRAGAATNILIRPAPPGDFDMRTLVRASLSRNFELTGLLVVFADDSFMQFGPAYCDADPCVGAGYYFDSVQAGALVAGNFASPGFAGTADHLRLVRLGNTYTAHYLVDDGLWISLGTHLSDLPPRSIGLIAAQAPSAGAFAEFDWFEVREP